MKNILFYILFVLSIVALYGLTFSFAQEKEPAGKTVYVEKKCGTCHSVESAGLTSKKKDAVDLSNSGVNNAETIAKYLKKEVKLDDKNHKTAFKGTDEELKDLAAWLESLKKEESK
ncbi:MAG: cytochrome c [Ignavibacteriaceae bacterium]